jgi:hypothetical protein
MLVHRHRADWARRMNRGHIRKRGESWYLRVYAGTDPKTGRERRLVRTVKGSEKEARRALSQLIAEADRGQIPVEQSTLAAYLGRWLEAYAKPNTQPITYKRYEELVRIHIVPNIGRLRLNRLEPYHLQGLYSRVQETNCPRTALKVHRLLFQALKQAVRWVLFRSMSLQWWMLRRLNSLLHSSRPQATSNGSLQSLRACTRERWFTWLL